MHNEPRLLSDRELRVIRGKVLSGVASVDEMLSVFGHIQIIEANLDVLDGWEVFQEDEHWRKGWRVAFGIPADSEYIYKADTPLHLLSEEGRAQLLANTLDAEVQAGNVDWKAFEKSLGLEL
jgi:hypothetical protein